MSLRARASTEEEWSGRTKLAARLTIWRISCLSIWSTWIASSRHRLLDTLPRPCLEVRRGEANATKDLAFLVACALAAATIAGSPHIVISKKGTKPAIPF